MYYHNFQLHICCDLTDTQWYPILSSVVKCMQLALTCPIYLVYRYTQAETYVPAVPAYRGLPAVAALHHPGLCAWGNVDHMLAHTALDKEALSADRSVGRGLFRRCEDRGGRGRGGGEPGGWWSIWTWRFLFIFCGVGVGGVLHKYTHPNKSFHSQMLEVWGRVVLVFIV